MVAGAEEVVAFECQPSGAARRPGGELRRPVGAAVAIVVVQRLDEAAARNDHAAARVEGHRARRRPAAAADQVGQGTAVSGVPGLRGGDAPERRVSARRGQGEGGGGGRVLRAAQAGRAAPGDEGGRGLGRHGPRSAVHLR